MREPWIWGSVIVNSAGGCLSCRPRAGLTTDEPAPRPFLIMLVLRASLSPGLLAPCRGGERWRIRTRSVALCLLSLAPQRIAELIEFALERLDLLLGET